MILSVIILTHNEERHIARCLDAIASIAFEAIVVDSFSTDRTVDIAVKRGARVLQNKFINQALQFQWALENGAIASPWVMRLDADEVIEPDLAQEISEKLPTLGPDVAGVNLKRKHIFMGRVIRHGGRCPLILLRIWRNGQGRVENRWMDEHVIVWGGKTVTFSGGFADHNLNDLTHFTDKHNKYATREAIEILDQKYALTTRGRESYASNSSYQSRRKRFLKTAFYNKLPFWLASSGYFFYRYFILLGFLDGTSGLIYHFLQGWWYRFLVGAKVAEYEAALGSAGATADRTKIIEDLTGYKLR